MIESKKTYGVLLTRGQPFHIGHIAVIEQALKENDRVLVVIGSADKCNTDRNPLCDETRRFLFSKLKKYLGLCGSKRLSFLCLADWSDDNHIPYESSVGSTNTDFESVNKEWGMYLYYNIVSCIRVKDFNFYYNDNLDIIKSWFPKYIDERVHVITSKRIPRVSSSEVRQAFKDDNMSYLVKVLPYLTEEELDSFKERFINL